MEEENLWKHPDEPPGLAHPAASNVQARRKGDSKSWQAAPQIHKSSMEIERRYGATPLLTTAVVKSEAGQEKETSLAVCTRA